MEPLKSDADLSLLEKLPPSAPGPSLVWSAVADCDAKVDLGPSRGGHRFIVPITGGRVYDGPAGTGLNGCIPPGGADRQFLRSDGVKELYSVPPFI